MRKALVASGLWSKSARASESVIRVERLKLRLAGLTPLLLVVKRSPYPKGDAEAVSLTWGSNTTTDCEQAVALSIANSTPKVGGQKSFAKPPEGRYAGDMSHHATMPTTNNRPPATWDTWRGWREICSKRLGGFAL